MKKTHTAGNKVDTQAETVKAQITDFLNKCEEVKNCKFIMATTKIKDLLKSIVNSVELYELFNTVASNFDYIAAKQKCFVEADGVYGNSRVVLPDTVGDRLAFIFCLLVEFDRDEINFNLFLQKYYPKDGSYYASYHLFCDEVIGSLQALVCDIFSRELQEDQPNQNAIPQSVQSQFQAQPQSQIAQNTQSARSILPQVMPAFQTANMQKANMQRSALISTVCMLIDSELENLEASALVAEDKESGRYILESLTLAIRAGDATLIKSLTCGYNYFVIQTSLVTEGLSLLFQAVGDYLNLL